MNNVTLAQLAELTGGKVIGNPETKITRVRPIEEAGPGDFLPRSLHHGGSMIGRDDYLPGLLPRLQKLYRGFCTRL